MSQFINRHYLKFFYISEFLISSALGMIPLMTILSFMLSTLSHSSFAYAMVLALYNVSSTLPKMYVAKKLSGKKNTFNSLLALRVFQLFIWLSMSILFVFNQGQSYLIIIFCMLYLLYALIKGSIEVLNIDIYSRVIDRNRIGKFFGYKYSLNSLAEFLGAVILVGIFDRLELSSNYAVIFMCVLILDFISFMVLCSLKGKFKLNEEAINIKTVQINKDVCVSNGVLYSNVKTSSEHKRNLVKRFISYIKICYSVFRDEIKMIIETDSVYCSFLKANVISILGASVASFFIPYGTKTLGLTINYVSVANVVWLVSKVVSSIIWGYVVDFVGSKYVMIGSRVSLLVSYILAINLKNLEMFYLIMVLHGISSSALVIMAQNIFIEISGNKGALYSAINSVVCTPFFVVMPLLTSFLSENFGYKVAFMISMLPLITSIIFMFKIKLKKSKKELAVKAH